MRTHGLRKTGAQNKYLGAEFRLGIFVWHRMRLLPITLRGRLHPAPPAAGSNAVWNRNRRASPVVQALRVEAVIARKCGRSVAFTALWRQRCAMCHLAITECRQRAPEVTERRSQTDAGTRIYLTSRWGTPHIGILERLVTGFSLSTCRTCGTRPFKIYVIRD